MPQSVSNAAPFTVLPQSLSRTFVHSREYPVIENEYRNGESRRSVLADNSRKRWRIAKRLAAAKLQALLGFYDSRKGATVPFCFCDPYEANPQFSHDPAGASPYARYTARFEGEWNQSGRARQDER